VGELEDATAEGGDGGGDFERHVAGGVGYGLLWFSRR